MDALHSVHRGTQKRLYALTIRSYDSNHMTTEFADFVATQDARNTIQLNIRKYTLMLCEALENDFTRRYPNSDPYKFYIESGRKYHKIVMETESQSKSVHAFVDQKTGEVFKPASYKAPAKIVRYRLLEIASREECFERADWAGGYLYIR